MSRYFKNYEDKYNPFLSIKRPIVIKAKVNVNKNDVRFNVGNVKEIDSTVRKVTRDLSRKYNCLAFSSFNEINLIITNPSKIISNKGKLETHNVVSLFSQEIFMRYNELSRNRDVNFVSVNTFNIFEDKIKSYLYDRQTVGFNDYISFLASKLFSYSQLKNKKKEELLDIIESISPSLKLIKKYIKNGFTVLNGFEVEVNDINNIRDINNINSNNIAIKEVGFNQTNVSSDFVIEEDI